MKKDEIKVQEIVLNVKGKEIRLSPDEAKELLNCLEDVFGKKEGVTFYPYYVQPYVYTYPHYSDGTVSITVGDTVPYQLSQTDREAVLRTHT